MKLKLFIILSLTIFISSGSFDLKRYLNDRISAQSSDINISHAELELARALNINAVYHYDNTNEVIGSKQWLISTTYLAKSRSKAAIELARYYHLKSDEVDVRSVILKFRGAAVQWFGEAIAMGNEQAVVELAYFYLDDKAIESAAKTISTLEKTQDNIGIFLALAIALGDYQEIVAIKNSLEFKLASSRVINNRQNLTPRTEKSAAPSESTPPKSTSLKSASTSPNLQRFNQLLGLIERFHVFEQSEAIARSTTSSKNKSNAKLSTAKNLTPPLIDNQVSPSCENSFQLLASSFNLLKRAETIIREVKNTKIGKHFCFEQPRYLPFKVLDCSSNKQIAIECDEENLALIAPVINSRYLGLITEQGGANVHYGTLYLDKNDSSDVLTHELSHLIGFVDEYPLREGHKACSIPKNALSKPIANNVSLFDVDFLSENSAKIENANIDKTTLELRERVLEAIPWRELIKPTTPIFHFKQQKLALGTPKSHENEIGLYTTRTCDQSKAYAFKPITQQTLLEHNEMSFPLVYEQLLKLKADQNSYRMPSFHYNIALAKFKKGDEEAARHWLNLAAEIETNISRKETIKKGAF